VSIAFVVVSWRFREGDDGDTAGEEELKGGLGCLEGTEEGGR
jgi:hypothetical protein